MCPPAATPASPSDSPPLHYNIHYHDNSLAKLHSFICAPLNYNFSPLMMQYLVLGVLWTMPFQLCHSWCFIINQSSTHYGALQNGAIPHLFLSHLTQRYSTSWPPRQKVLLHRFLFCGIVSVCPGGYFLQICFTNYTFLMIFPFGFLKLSTCVVFCMVLTPSVTSFHRFLCLL